MTAEARSREQRRRDAEHRLAHDVDVIELDALPPERERFAARAGFDPRESSTRFSWFRITPHRIQAWREENELRGRELMRDGKWLI